MLDNVIVVWPEIVVALGQTFYMMMITLSVAV